MRMSCEEEERCLLCPYCLERLNKAVRLPCGHNFCEECVGRMRRGGLTAGESKRVVNEEGMSEDGVVVVKTLCPVCLKEFKEGDEQANEELRELIEGRKVYYCDDCEGDERRVATKFCVVCKDEGRSLDVFVMNTGMKHTKVRHKKDMWHLRNHLFVWDFMGISIQKWMMMGKRKRRNTQFV